VAAAVASLVFGWLAPVGDYRVALLATSLLALAAAVWTLWLPEGEPNFGATAPSFVSE
jgi:hypothetical protein